MSPEKYAEAGTEHAHQVALFMWMNSKLDNFPCLRWAYAIPNGGDRNIKVAARLKAEGVKAGVSDLCLPFARMGYHGFYIELKRPGGVESEKQVEFGKFLKSENYLYAMFDHWEKARNAIEWYLSNDCPF